MSTKRPSRKQPAPPPAQGAIYCHTCGRIMSPTKPNQNSTPQKYCSARCQRTRPRPRPHSTGPTEPTEPIEQRIEGTFVRMMGECGGNGAGSVIVACGDVEGVVFPSGGNRGGGEDGGTRRERSEEDESDEDEDEDDGGGVPVIGDGVAVIADHRTVQVDPRKAGMERARKREMVRQAARRLVAFGAAIGEAGQIRGVEAVQAGRVVESSFAKGEWGIRWRE